MALSGPDDPASLHPAVARWNARAASAMPEMSETLASIHTQLQALAKTCADNQALLRPIAQTDPGIEATIEQLEEALADFHVELETLLVQANRSLKAGSRLSEKLLRLRGKAASAVVPATPVTLPAPLGHQSEAEWAARVHALELENTALRQANHDAKPKTSALPLEVQEELVRLREEVEQLREAAAASPEVDIPELPSLQGLDLQELALDEQGKRRPLGMILVRSGVISQDQLETALREQRSSWHRHIGAILIDLGFADEISIARALAAQTKLPFVRLGNERIDRAAVALLSRQMAHHHSSIPIREELGKLVVAMANPLDLVALEDIQIATNRPLSPVVASVSDLRSALREFYDRSVT